MTDAKALEKLRGPNTCTDPGCDCREVIAHAIRAIEDRAALEEKLWTVGLPDSIAIFCDHIRAHQKGGE
jgi:hypothetical protein